MASVSVASPRLAALPSEGVVFDYDVIGRRTANQDDSVTAAKNFDDAIDLRLRQHGGRAFDAATIDGLPHAYAFRIWADNSLKEIRTWRLGHASERHESVGDWRFSSSLGAWRAALDADFVLISLFVDGRNTSGRVKKAVLWGGALVVPDAIACVVHLETGRIVWCNTRGLRQDLTLRAGAQTEVDSLINGMLLSGDGSPIEPRPTGPRLARAAPIEDPGPAPTPVTASKLHAP